METDSRTVTPFGKESANPSRCCYAMHQFLLASSYEHPLVLPHVLHFMHVPLRTSVKFPQPPQASPS